MKLRRIRFVVLLSVLVVLCLFLWPMSAPVHGPGISVMTWNVGNAARPVPSMAQVAEIVRQQGRPSVLLLQESHSSRFLSQLAAELGYAHVLPQPGEKNAGVDTAILSDYPLTFAQSLRWPVKPFTGSGLLARADTPIGPILLGSVHLPAMLKPRDKQHRVLVRARQTLQTLWQELCGETGRSAAVRDLLASIAPWSGRVVVGGDFNTLSWSRALLPVHVALDDALCPGWNMFHGTYVLVEGSLYPRIDFLFHDSGLQAREGMVGTCTPGDHLPVRAVFYGN